MWILILSTYIMTGNVTGGAGVSTIAVEYSSSDKCEKAKAAALAMVANSERLSLRAACTEK